MTIELLGVLGAEHRITTDINFFAAGPEITSAQAKTGTYSYPRYTSRGPMGRKLLTPVTAMRLGFWMYLTNTTFQGTTLLYFGGMGLGYNSSVNFLVVRMRSDTGVLEVLRNNNQTTEANELLASVALPSAFGTTGTWFHVGVTHKVHATDGFLSVYIGGTRVLNYTGDTRPSNNSGSTQYAATLANILIAGGVSTSGLHGFMGSNAGNAGCYVDDYYVESYVGEDDGPVPSRRFMPALPNGVGHEAQWTGVGSGTNWQNVDDNPNNGDTDYNKAVAADLRDTFTYSDITVPVDHRIVSVIPSYFAKRLDSLIQHKLSVHAFDGLSYIDSADLDLTMSYDVPVIARLLTQPDGSDWNEADFNNMQFGYKSRGTF